MNGKSEAANSGTNTAPSAGKGEERPDEGYDIRIARDGTWYHEGRPIRRLALVRLFSTVLRRDEAGDYWLITPAERGRITVEDAPFIAEEMEVEGEGVGQILKFRTNTERWFTAGPEHPIRVEEDPETGEPSPYLRLSGEGKTAIEARLNRPVFYQLVELAEETAEGHLQVLSGGHAFVLGRSA